MDFTTYFDSQTLSVHLKQGSVPLAKRGMPGAWTCVELGTTPLTAEELEHFAETLLHDPTLLECTNEGSFIAQKDGYRIVGARTPLIHGIDITIVRKTRQLSLHDLGVSDSLKQRILQRSEGIVIAGSPGEGKSTLAQAIIHFLVSQKKIIKTIENPRDLAVPHTVTQYSLANARRGELHDVLLLSRPDYTVFDELRKTADFSLYVDLRLAGIGMIGVVHGASPLDAIARFVGKIELGMIPQIVDHVIFVKGGRIAQELTLSLEVGLPSGLQNDLARPMVVIRDAKTNTPLAQLYAFGNETVLMPITPTTQTKEVPREEKKGTPIPFELKASDNSIILHVDPTLATGALTVKLDTDPVAHVLVGKKGTIKLREDSQTAKTILEGIKKGKKVVVEKSA